MIARDISNIIVDRATKMPVVSITGPRQSGKTTLVKQLFPHYNYISLENILHRENAKADPFDFLKRNGPNLIIDEAQYVPELFSYIQVLVDESGKMGEYILTGSQHFLLMEKVSQSLAGRVAIFNLLPLSLHELSNARLLPNDYITTLWKGAYPVLYDRDLQPTEWLPEYVETYVERDLRQIINVNDLSTFRNFLRICAGHIGQLVNFSSIGNQIGVSYQTVKNWLSILELSFVVYRLQPHHANYNKRLVKSPKLYFHDTGLACSLLGITEESQVHSHYLKGALFENLVINEFMKQAYNRGMRPSLYFWRDSTGNEIDLIIERGNTIEAIEIKSAKTIHNDFFKGLSNYEGFSGIGVENCSLIYGGDEDFKRPQGRVRSWQSEELWG